MDTSVFESHIIYCPQCKTEQSHTELRSSSHVVSKKEQNGMPSEIKWYEESNSNINILYYYLWSCKNCFYTDKITNFFKAETAISEQLKNYRRTAKELNRSSNSFLSTCTSYISLEKSQTYDKSLLQLYTYLFTLTKMPESAEINNLIGDIYLRASWLLKDSSVDKSLEKQSISSNNFDEELHQKFEHLVQSFKKFELEIESFKTTTVNLLHKSVTDENKESLKEHYKHLKGFNTNLDKTVRYINSLNSKFTENTETIAQSGSKKAIVKEKTFEGVLNELRKYWIDIPTNEKSALLGSNEFYRKAINTGYFGGNIQNLCNSFKVIIYGYEVLNEYSNLKEFLDGGLKLLYNLFKTLKADVIELEDKREKLKKRIDSINTDQLSSSSVLVESLAEIDTVLQLKRTNMRTIRDYSGQFKSTRDHAKEKLIKDELDLIDTLIDEKSLTSQEEAKSYLLSQNITPEVIERYFKTEAPSKKEKQKKSSLMGFLKGF